MIDLETIRAYCLNFPEAFEDHPWGDTVFKVGKKIFVFVHGADDGLSVTVKLPPELRDLYDQLNFRRPMFPRNETTEPIFGNWRRA